MPANFRDQFLFAGDDARLRTAKKFVSAEQHKRKTGCNARTRSGFVSSGGGKVDKASRTEVFDYR